RLAQRGLGVAHHDPTKASSEERLIVERVARHQDLLGWNVQVLCETTKRISLGDSPRENVQVASGRKEYIAVEVGEPAAHLVHQTRVVEEEGAAPLLRNALALHAGEAAQRSDDRLDADPALVDLPLHG